MLFEDEYKLYKQLIIEADEIQKQADENEKIENSLENDEDPDKAIEDNTEKEEPAEEKSDDSSKESGEEKSEDESGEEKDEEESGEEKSDDSSKESKKELAKTFVDAGFENTKKGVFVNKDFSENFSIGINFNTANESVFEDLAYKIICEESEQIKLTFKIKQKDTDEEKTGELLVPKDADQETINKLIEDKIKAEFGEDSLTTPDKSNTDNELLKDKSLVNTIITAFEKLDDDEQSAFEFFYGDKLINVIKAGNTEEK